MTSRRNLLVGAGALGVAAAAGYQVAQSPDYEAANRALRQHRPSTVNGEFEYLVHNASLAANSHNTQPWWFSGSQNRALIHPDFSRATPVVDPDNHHLFCSLGCAAENMLIAARADGREGRIEVLSEQDGTVQVDFVSADPQAGAAFDAITQRQCTRSVYDGRAVPTEVLQRLENASKLDGCEMMLITDPARVRSVSEIILAANRVQTEDPQFVSELKYWIRFNSRAAIDSADGLYSACSGNPTLPTWIGKRLFDFVFSADSENGKLAKVLESSSGLALFFSDKDDPSHWVQAGRCYQRFALHATAEGLKHAFVNQPLEVSQYRMPLGSLLGLGDRRPDLLIRFGYAEPMPYSLRRPLSAVIRQA